MDFETTAKIITNIIVTFVQAGVAVWVASGMGTDKIALGAFVGAGLSAVWNLIIKPFLKSQGWMK